MIRTVRRGATREALVAALARIEGLEDDPNRNDAKQSAEEALHSRIAYLDRTGRDAELRREDIPLDPSIVT